MVAMAFCRSCSPLFSSSSPASMGTPNTHFRISSPPLFYSTVITRHATRTVGTKKADTLMRCVLPQREHRSKHYSRIKAVRRRRLYFQSDTYVLWNQGKMRNLFPRKS